MAKQDKSKEAAKERAKTRAYQMLLNNHSYAEIAYELGIAKSTAYNYAQEKLAEVTARDIETLLDKRDRELVKLTSYEQSLLEALQKDSATEIDPETGRVYRDGAKTKVALIRELRALSDHRCKLLGLYAPDKIEQTIASPEPENTIDYNSLDADELKQLFADRLRGDLDSSS